METIKISYKHFKELLSDYWIDYFIINFTDKNNEKPEGCLNIDNRINKFYLQARLDIKKGYCYYNQKRVRYSDKEVIKLLNNQNFNITAISNNTIYTIEHNNNK